MGRPRPHPCMDCGATVTGARYVRCRPCGWRHFLVTQYGTYRPQRMTPLCVQPDEVDEMVIERLIAGDPPAGATTAERQYAAEILTRRGLSARQIAERMGLSARTVVRLRSRTRAAA